MSTKGFTGKVALVTGASSGIGEATAVRLKSMGYTVYAAARRTERMDALARAGIKVLKMDVTKDQDMTDGIDTIIRESKRIDVLVNNAGYGSYGALEDVPLSEARYQFEVNLFGLARLTQLALPHMRAQKSGYIFNISSIGGKIWEPLGSWYHATKFAVEGLSDSIRVELAPHGIHVVVIEPGAIKTEWAGIAAENVLKTSGKGAYAAQAAAHARLLGSADTSNMRPSDPGVIANTIAKALLARRPKTRYASGRLAKMTIFMANTFSDRTMDRVITSMLGSFSK